MARVVNGIATELLGVRLLSTERFADERGWFRVSYSDADCAEVLGECPAFIQDNHSHSAPWVLRGLHYQLPPAAQGKLVGVLRGEIYDVAVDLRRSSPTFGRWAAWRLSAENGQLLWLPRGCAHGFLALDDGAEILYKIDAPYRTDAECCLCWDDPTLDIPWPLAGREPLLSSRDRAGTPLAQAECFD